MKPLFFNVATVARRLSEQFCKNAALFNRQSSPLYIAFINRIFNKRRHSVRHMISTFAKHRRDILYIWEIQHLRYSIRDTTQYINMQRLPNTRPSLYCRLLLHQRPEVKNSLFLAVLMHRIHSYFLLKARNSIIMRVQISVVENSAAF